MLTTATTDSLDASHEVVPLGSHALDTLSEFALRVSIEFKAQAEIRRRLEEDDAAAILTTARDAPTQRECEQVRIAYAELRAILGDASDPRLRARLQSVCERLTGANMPPRGPSPLSSRELDVISLVALGCTNAEVARRLHLQPETVKGYLRNATRKLGTHSRTETVATARVLGYLP